MTDPSTLPLAQLYSHFEATGLIARVIELARDEDLGTRGDVTSLTSVPEGARTTAAIVARQDATLAGLAILPALARTFAPGSTLRVHARDGEPTAKGAILAEVDGPKREILGLERTALNFIGRLSGIATQTRRFVDAMERGGAVRARLYDTRKTTPGLRVLEKYAVRCGGGRCHRIGLFDAVLIKDNHIAGVPLERLGRVVEAASRTARSLHPAPAFVEVEVDSLEQLDQILRLPAGVVDIVLLDNMDLAQLREAVCRRDASTSRPELESSGGVRLDSVRAIAETGVDRISAGALTHGAIWVDVAMDIAS